MYLEYVFLPSSQDIAEFVEGMQATGIATLIKHHPVILMNLFIHNYSVKVTAQYLCDLLRPLLSPRGHNRREEEEAIVLNWRDYLQDIEGILYDIPTLTAYEYTIESLGTRLNFIILVYIFLRGSN